MTMLTVVCGLVVLGFCGAGPLQGSDLEKAKDFLEWDGINLNSEEILQEVLPKLIAKVYNQADQLSELKTEMVILKDNLSKLQRDCDHLHEKTIRNGEQSNLAENQPEIAGKVVRQKRQLLNTSYEGPVGFMAGFGSTCQNDIGINQNVVFKTVSTNLGGAYNSLHGLFMAPRAGVYLFSASLLSDTLPHSRSVHAAIVVNGRKVAKVLAFSEANQHRDQGANTIIVELKQGDQVWVKNIDNDDATICGINGFSTFSGYLLYPY